jgi:hypothetical protein
VWGGGLHSFCLCRTVYYSFSLLFGVSSFLPEILVHYSFYSSITCFEDFSLSMIQTLKIPFSVLYLVLPFMYKLLSLVHSAREAQSRRPVVAASIRTSMFIRLLYDTTLTNMTPYFLPSYLAHLYCVEIFLFNL